MWNGELVKVDAGGNARWGRHVPLNDTERTFCYEADSIFRLYTDTERVYFRAFFAGMDVITEAGNVPRGHGQFRLTELDAGEDGQGRSTNGKDELFGTMEWREVDGHDTGVITVTRGTGRWGGATGSFDVRFPAFCAFDPAASYNVTEPIDTLFFIEGSGHLSL